MKTTQENPIKKENLLDAAYELVMLKGYVATSVEEICSKAGTTKGSFFYYFDSKEDLAKALLTRTCSSQMKTKDELFGKDPYKRVFGQVDMVIEMSQSPGGSKGCIKGMLAHELSDTHPEIRRICCEFFEKMATDFAKDLKEAKAQYGGSFDPYSLAEHFITVLQGGFILTKVQGNNKALIKSLEHFKKYLQSLIKK